MAVGLWMDQCLARSLLFHSSNAFVILISQIRIIKAFELWNRARGPCIFFSMGGGSLAIINHLFPSLHNMLTHANVKEGHIHKHLPDRQNSQWATVCYSRVDLRGCQKCGQVTGYRHRPLHQPHDVSLHIPWHPDALKWTPQMTWKSKQKLHFFWCLLAVANTSSCITATYSSKLLCQTLYT